MKNSSLQVYQSYLVTTYIFFAFSFGYMYNVIIRTPYANGAGES